VTPALFVQRQGPRGGDPVALLNGVMMTASSWALTTRALSTRFDCLLHDFRGQLRSLDAGAPEQMLVHAHDLAAILDEQEIARAHLVGTSYGGEVAMLFALAYPERVRSLTLIACVPHVEPPLRAIVTEWREAALRSPERLYDLTAPYNFSPDFLNAALLEAGCSRLALAPPRFFTALAGLCDAFLQLDITARLDEIAAPALVIAAECDALKPVHYSELLAARIPNAALRVIEGAGHAVVIERAAAVNALIVEQLERA
jgi:3-oxoadipate enol-lactonase